MRLCDEGGSSILGVKEHFLWVLDAPIQEKIKVDVCLIQGLKQEN